MKVQQFLRFFQFTQFFKLRKNPQILKRCDILLAFFSVLLMLKNSAELGINETFISCWWDLGNQFFFRYELCRVWYWWNLFLCSWHFRKSLVLLIRALISSVENVVSHEMARMQSMIEKNISAVWNQILTHSIEFDMQDLECQSLKRICYTEKQARRLQDCSQGALNSVLCVSPRVFEAEWISMRSSLKRIHMIHLIWFFNGIMTMNQLLLVWLNRVASKRFGNNAFLISEMLFHVYERTLIGEYDECQKPAKEF